MSCDVTAASASGQTILGRVPLAVFVALVLVVAGCSDDATKEVVVAQPDRGEGLSVREGDLGIEVIAPADGAVVPTTFEVEVETVGVKLSPKGRTIDGEGHFHVLIDRGCMPPGELIAVNDMSVHVGDGSDSVELTLPPGRHSLCIQLGDGFHAAVSLTDEIVVNVVDETAVGSQPPGGD